MQISCFFFNIKQRFLWDISRLGKKRISRTGMYSVPPSGKVGRKRSPSAKAEIGSFWMRNSPGSWHVLTLLGLSSHKNRLVVFHDMFLQMVTFDSPKIGAKDLTIPTVLWQWRPFALRGPPRSSRHEGGPFDPSAPDSPAFRGKRRVKNGTKKQWPSSSKQNACYLKYFLFLLYVLTKYVVFCSCSLQLLSTSCQGHTHPLIIVQGEPWFARGCGHLDQSDADAIVLGGHIAGQLIDAPNGLVGPILCNDIQ